MVGTISDAGTLGMQVPYTVMMWLRPSGIEWNQATSYAFAIASSFSCYFTEAQTLMCESSQLCEKL